MNTSQEQQTDDWLSPERAEVEQKKWMEWAQLQSLNAAANGNTEWLSRFIPGHRRNVNRNNR